MSNIQKFKEKLKADAGLYARAQQAEQAYAMALSRLSEEAGVPCAPSEFLPPATEIDLADLDRVSGGFSTNVMPEFPSV